MEHTCRSEGCSIRAYKIFKGKYYCYSHYDAEKLNDTAKSSRIAGKLIKWLFARKYVSYSHEGASRIGKHTRIGAFLLSILAYLFFFVILPAIPIFILLAVILKWELW